MEFSVSKHQFYVKNMNGSDSSAKSSPENKNIPFWQSKRNFPPPLVEDINKWDTLQPTDNFDLGDLDENE